MSESLATRHGVHASPAVDAEVVSPLGWILVLERGLGRLVDSAAALILGAEILVLFAGMVARYGFNRPMVWSDEVASILFLWLAMLGAVIATRRGEHMRLTFVLEHLPRAWQPRMQALANAAVAGFLAVILLPSLEYVHDEAEILTPALSLPNSCRVAALGVGIALMLLMTLTRLYRQFGVVTAATALAAVAGLMSVMVFAAPAVTLLGNGSLVLFFVLIVGFAVLFGVPIAFAFGLGTISYLGIMTHAPMSVVIGRIDEGASNLVLLSVPLFVYLGYLLVLTGMAQVMVTFLAALLGHVRGGLAYVLLGAMYLVSGISGSKAADMAAVAPVLFPEMERRGYQRGELVALLSASGAMSETIPPSIVLITIGSVTGVSISALFGAGLLPAATLALILCVVARLRCGREKMQHVRRASLRVIGKTFLMSLPALVLPFIIRGAVVEGIATATEVSTIGVAYAAFIGIVLYRSFDLRRAYQMLIDSAALSGSILFIIGTATAMAWALTQSGFSSDLAALMTKVPGGAAGFLGISILVFVLLGSLLEGIPAIVLFGPLLFPIARQFGISDVHYAIVVILAMGLGLFAPPFGVGYYAACAVGQARPDAAMTRIWPYLAALFIGVCLIALFPQLTIGRP
jgi:tripartite ATP-independent transporter DctM subunit